jgi:hypothetical protein
MPAVAVYVDEPIWQWRGRRWCHLTADDGEELHRFAAELGLRRRWFQSKPERPWHDHYDLPEEVRELALAYGAVALSTVEMGRMQADRRRAARLDDSARGRRCPGRRQAVPVERQAQASAPSPTGQTSLDGSVDD